MDSTENARAPLGGDIVTDNEAKTKAGWMGIDEWRSMKDV
jgi:hypothetical protein